MTYMHISSQARSWFPSNHQLLAQTYQLVEKNLSLQWDLTTVKSLIISGPSVNVCSYLWAARYSQLHSVWCTLMYNKINLPRLHPCTHRWFFSKHAGWTKHVNFLTVWRKKQTILRLTSWVSVEACHIPERITAETMFPNDEKYFRMTRKTN